MVRVIRFVRFVVLSRCGQVLSGLDIPLQVLVYGPEQKVVDVRGCVYVNGAPHLVSKKRDIEELLEILA